MGTKTLIGWTDITWNIAVGCSKVDADCKFCYMYRQSLNGTRYKPDQVVKTKTVFDLPLRIKQTESAVWPGQPLVFTSSLTDVFHPDIDPFRHQMWHIIRERPDLVFQILTKRPERIKENLPDDWGTGYRNVWLGTSVGSQKGIDRAYELLHVPAHIRFLSIEPLHGEVDISGVLGPGYGAPAFVDGDEEIWGFDWVIVGGESGNDNGKYRYRPCELEWIRSLVRKCDEANVAVFVKQLGTHLAKQMKLKDRAGADMAEWPEDLQIQQFPYK